MRAFKRIFLVVYAASWAVGCSGSAPSDLFDPVHVEAPETVPSPGGPSVGHPEERATAGKPPGPRGEDRDDGDEKEEPGGPAQTCATEVEENDDSTQATQLSSCITGELADEEDVDFFRIVAPVAGARMTITHEERRPIRYRVSNEGGLLPFRNVTFTEDDPVVVEVEPGAAYLLRLTSPSQGSGKRPYKIAITFE